MLLRARESWLEVLGDEERLKLEQRPVTFCGGLILQEQEEERGRQSSMAGQRRASACLSFRFSDLFMDGRFADNSGNVTGNHDEAVNESCLYD